MRIIIKGKTPSVNNLYGHNHFGSTYMKKEAKFLRAEIIKTVQEQAIKQGFKLEDWSGRLLRCSVIIHEDWFCKKPLGKVKVKDISNREKFLVDSVFLGLELGDEFIWQHTMTKQDSTQQIAIVDLDFWKP